MTNPLGTCVTSYHLPLNLNSNAGKSITLLHFLCRGAKEKANITKHVYDDCFDDIVVLICELTNIFVLREALCTNAICHRPKPRCRFLRVIQVVGWRLCKQRNKGSNGDGINEAFNEAIEGACNMCVCVCV
jgi:hypothetical protein